MEFSIIQHFLFISVLLSTISCAFIQRTKWLFKTSKFIIIYSLIINLFLGAVFCYTFTNISFPNSLWVGLFSFIGADSFYKSLEGKIASHSELRSRRKK